MPKGVFNLINGLGPEVGAAMSAHPGIDMMSFTGSTRAGIDVVQRAAPTVKRVTQELGGKSPNVILEDADLAKAIAGGTAHCFNNTGQSCNAPTRMLVPLAKMKEAAAIAKSVADKAKPGDPRAPRAPPWAPSSTACSGRRSRASSRRASTRARRWSPAASACRRASTRASTCVPPCSPT